MKTLTAFSGLIEAARQKAPEVALILGSGMGPIAERVQARESVPFIQVPGLEATTVVGHSGQLSLGDWVGRRVLVFEGRMHFYECSSWRSVEAPVQAARFLGAKVLLLTNASGGIADALVPGSLMCIRDHIEWTRPNCWRSRPSTSSPYSPRLQFLLRKAADSLDLPLHEGTYAAVTGPCYETPAEIRALKNWGADAVGMSTAREIQAGFAGGLECAAISLITNRAAGLSSGPINHDEVLGTAARATERLGHLLELFLQMI